ncbi:MAG: hypothetical protein QM765_08135 [Myxococcales bacterium]
MGRGIVVSFNGEPSEFEFSKVERDKLYGRKVRLVVDEQGRPCKPALLTRDGSAVAPPGCVAHLYVDDRFEAIERDQLKAVDDQGNPKALVKSTLGVEQKLVGPVDPSRVLECMVMSTYALTPTKLGDALKAGLDGGGIYEAPFNYRDDYNPELLLPHQERVRLLRARRQPPQVRVPRPRESSPRPRWP